MPKVSEPIIIQSGTCTECRSRERINQNGKISPHSHGGGWCDGAKNPPVHGTV